MNEIYESFSGYLTEDSKKFLVAFSGGLDSTVLLYALKQALVKEKLNKEILAIHVDHKQNRNSKNWIEHCKKFCETMQVSFACSQIKSNKKALSENDLRNLRYEIFSEFVEKFSISLYLSGFLKFIFAKKFSIPYICLNTNKYKFEISILKKLFEYKIDIICLAGFMKILSKKFIRNFKRKIINIHPSLLPKYKGLNTHERAIKNKDKFAGASIHKVTEKLDSGKVILQKKVKICRNDTPKKLAKKILIEEHKLYPSAIMKIFNP